MLNSVNQKGICYR